jgi:hypothetical protein
MIFFSRYFRRKKVAGSLIHRDQFTRSFCLNSSRVCRRVPRQYQTSATHYKTDNEEQIMKANKGNEVNQQVKDNSIQHPGYGGSDGSATFNGGKLNTCGKA